MEIGMSLACFYPMPPEEAALEAKKLNIKVCEVFLNTVSELEEDYLQELRSLCDQNGLRVHSVHPFTSAMENYLFFSPYPRRVRDAVDFYRRYADAAKILGASVVNIHGDRGLGLADFDQYVECLDPLLGLQKETGIIFALENVYYSSVAHPDFTARLCRQVPEICFTYDIKQAVKGGQDPYALLDAMGERIVNFHVNDCDFGHVCLLPGCGTVDFERISEAFHNNGYIGPALIEVYRKDFEDPREIQMSKTFLENKFLLAN